MPPQTSESAFLTAVFHDAEAMWTREFEAAGLQYTPARLTIFHDQVHTACGTQSAAVGPFYCPADRGVYLDTRFFDQLGRTVGVRLGAFARAYVVAHEVAHHVQVLLGITGRVRAADQRDPAGTNARSVRLELQADCFAGVWKHATYERGQLTGADFEDALRAAAIVGDDFQQRRATGTISPENSDARLVPATPALVDDRVPAGGARRVRYVRLVERSPGTSEATCSASARSSTCCGVSRLTTGRRRRCTPCGTRFGARACGWCSSRRRGAWTSHAARQRSRRRWSAASSCAIPIARSAKCGPPAVLSARAAARDLRAAPRVRGERRRRRADRRARGRARAARRRPAAGRAAARRRRGRRLRSRGRSRRLQRRADQFDSDITQDRHPRAAFGLCDDTLIAVACDGRRTNVDAGLSMLELAG